MGVGNRVTQSCFNFNHADYTDDQTTHASGTKFGVLVSMSTSMVHHPCPDP